MKLKLNKKSGGKVFMPKIKAHKIVREIISDQQILDSILFQNKSFTVNDICNSLKEVQDNVDDNLENRVIAKLIYCINNGLIMRVSNERFASAILMREQMMYDLRSVK